MWRPYFQTWIFLVQYSFKLHQSEKNMTVAIWVCLCVHKQDANNHKTIPKDQSFGIKKEAVELHLKQGKHTINKWSLWGAKVSSGLTLLCLVVLFEAESFIIVVHLKPDWPPQAPVDVQQPLEDEHSVFLHTRAATHAETDNNHQRSGSQGGDILLAACHGGSVSGVRAGPGARSIHRGEAFHDGETPIRWEPPFYFKSTGVKSLSDRASRGEVEYFLWVTYRKVEKF